MTDKPKSIHEALAAVQHNVNEAYSPPFERDPSGGFRKKPQLDTSKPGGKIPDVKLAPDVKPDVATKMSNSGTSLGQAEKSVVSKSGGILSKAKEVAPAVARGVMSLARRNPVVAGATLAGAGLYAASKTDKGQEIVKSGEKALGLDTPVKYDPDKPTMGTQVGKPQEGEKASDVFSRIRSGNSPASTPATPKTEPAKTETPKPTSFSQAFKAAREKATEMGKPSTGQFDYDGKKYQTNVKGEKYVPMSQQTKIDTTTSQSTKETKPLPPMTSVVSSEPRVMPTNLTKPKEERESGGKKKMSEDTNPLIASFLALQEKNPSNMFEAAKKAKKDYDKDGKVESPKDEVWGSRFAAAKKAGKMEEESVDHLGSSTVTKDKKGYVDPSTPTEPYKKAPMSTGAGDVLDKAKNALDKTGVKEEAEVTLSQADLDHINSFFLEASVAPTRPEVAAEARPDKINDGVSQNDVTGTAESGKRKVKEEVEIEESHGAKFRETNFSVPNRKPDHVVDIGKDYGPEAKLHVWHNAGPKGKHTVAHVNKQAGTGSEVYASNNPKVSPEHARKYWMGEEVDLEEGMPASVIASKKKYAEMSDEDFAAKHGHKSEKELRDMAGRHGYGWNKATKTGSDHYVKRVAAAKKIDEASKPEVSVYDDTAHVKDKMGKVIASYSKKEHGADYMKKANAHMSKIKEEVIQEGRPKKNPTPEATERDPRKHIQVEAGRAAAGNVIDFHHNDGSKSKITPAMGRRITSHLNSLKPADRQSAVNKMHDSAEGLKV